jgi:glycosyltransferase involved in cell wall biosynthesis
MRVLISAYACEPNKGSEPGVGFACLRASATQHETWVITRANNVPAIESALVDFPFRDRIHLVGVELGPRALSAKRRLGSVGLHPYYDRWQVKMAEVALELDREVDFDVIHHATFASYWTRIGVAAVRKPLVVGPVGGAASSPLSLIPVLGWRGLPGELARRWARPLVSRMTGSRRAIGSAAIVLVQNPTAFRVLNGRGLEVVPNALIGAQDLVNPTSAEGSSTRAPVVFAARLVPWKGGTLALHAIRHIDDDSIILDVYGAGPDESRLRRMAQRLHIEERVRFKGLVSRDELLRALSRAGALLHPSLHDDAGLVIAEAMSVGTPVVCLDLAGPPVVASYWTKTPFRAVPASTPGATSAHLASALMEIHNRRGPADPTPRDVFVTRILDSYSRASVMCR